MTASHSSSLMLTSTRSRRMPALLTRMWRPPKASMAVLMRRCPPSQSATLSAVATQPRARETARRRLVDALFRPTDIAVLVYFRIVFGVVMAWDGVHAFQQHRVDRIVHADFLFNYWPFTFVKALPDSLLDGAY